MTQFYLSISSSLFILTSDGVGIHTQIHVIKNCFAQASGTPPLSQSLCRRKRLWHLGLINVPPSFWKHNVGMSLLSLFDNPDNMW